MYAAFVTLLNMSAASGILIAAVIAFRCFLRKAPKKYICLLWALVGLRLLCPFSISSALSAFNYIGHAEQGSGQIEYIQYNEKSEKPMGQLPVFTPEAPIAEGTASAPDFYLPTAMGIWAAGCTAMMGYAALSYAKVRKQVQQSLPLDASNLFLCDDIPSPFILGVLRPKIYLPSSLDGQQRESVIAHERAHIARLDYLWKPLGFLLLSIHWFNPLVWAAYALLCRDIEMACDEKVIAHMTPAQKQAYSTVLLTCSMPRKAVTACPLAFGEIGVKERIKGILHYKKPSFWLVSLCLGLCLVLAVGFLSNPLRTEDYIRFRRADTKYNQPHTYQFQLQTGKTVTSPVLFAEQWQAGALVQRVSCAVRNGETDLTFSVAESGSSYQIAVETAPTLTAAFSVPEGMQLMDVYSWHGAKDSPLTPGKQVLLAAYIFSGDGFMVFDFDNADFGQFGNRLYNQDCVILIYAAFPEVVSVQSSFTQEIYQFAVELPSGYSLKAQGPYHAGLYKDGEMVGRISSLLISDTDSETDILKNLGYDPNSPAMQYRKGTDPDWEFQYIDEDWQSTHYLHRVPGMVYDLMLEGTEPGEEVAAVIVPKLRRFLEEHPDAIVPTYTYLLLTGQANAAQISIRQKDGSSSSVVCGYGTYAEKSVVWLEPLESVYSIGGTTLMALDETGQIIWAYSVPEELGTAQRIQDGQWAIDRYSPEMS